MDDELKEDVAQLCIDVITGWYDGDLPDDTAKYAHKVALKLEKQGYEWEDHFDLAANIDDQLDYRNFRSGIVSLSNLFK